MDGFHHSESFAATPGKTSKVYIWLTRYGVLYFTVLIVMLLGSLNYKNNMGLLLTFLLVGIALISLFTTHRALAGLSFAHLSYAAAFAGDRMTVSLDAECMAAASPSFQFTINGSVGHGSLNADARETLSLSMPTDTRGEILLNRVRVETVYPLGLFRSWRTFYFDGAHGVVYPSPRRGPLPFGPGTAEGESGPSQSVPGGEDFNGHRLYQPGDPPRQIDWRVYSKGQGLFSKNFSTPTTSTVHLIWSLLPEGDPEYRLSVMCHAILKASMEQRRFGVRLPWAIMAPDAGPRHVHACLRQLALMGTAGSAS
ncbi:MAG: DUF58 domain-containing protein [Pseudomonadota bacterium]